jgi:acetyl esterase/lipase
MHNGFVTAIVAGGLAWGAIAEAQHLDDRSGWVEAPVAAPEQTIAYGKDPLQKLDFWRSRNVSGPAPLIVFVHGGGWSRGSKDNATGRWKAVHYPQQGYAFASINYRLVPGATVEDEAQDVAMALKALLDRATMLGIDRRRVVLMGHSAGAHLVALVGTDERYLSAAGLGFADIAGVIPIDGAGYDVPVQMADAGGFMKPIYQQAFGTNLAHERALSPTLHAGAPNAPRFLLLHVQRPDGIRQAQEFAAALKAAGTDVDEQQFPGYGLVGHMEINRRLGDPGYAATSAVDAWLRRVFGG